MVDDSLILSEDAALRDSPERAILDTPTNIVKNYISEYNTKIQCATIAATRPPMVCASTAFDVSSRKPSESSIAV